MYTVMIIEDELLVRIGLIESIPWKDLDLKIVAEESNGLDAYETFKKLKPDIIIADIKIPGMSGIELLKRIRQLDSSCAFIVVTCVEEFSVVQELVSLNIVSYLVKATMEIIDINNAMKKARQMLHDLGRVEEQNIHAIDINLLLHEYLETRSISPDTFIQLCDGNITNGLSGFLLFKLIWRNGETELLRRSIHNMITDRFSRWLAVSFIRDNGSILLLLKARPDYDQFHQLVRNLCEYTQNTFSVTLRAIVYCHEIDAASLPQQIQACADYGNHADYLYYRDLLYLSPDLKLEDPDITNSIMQIRNNIWTFRDGTSIAELSDLVDRLADSISQGWTALSSAALQVAGYICGHSKLPSHAYDDFCRAIREDSSAHAMFVAIREIITLPALKLAHVSERREILSAVNYVIDNITGDVTLTRTATVVGLHPTYFSYLFKKEMGINFVDFVSIIHLEHARELLKNRSLTIQNVSDQSGFSDSSYFCRKFKHAFGVSPSAWRLQI